MARSGFGLGMALKPDNLRPVDVNGTLRIVTPGGRSLSLVAEGGSLRLVLPGWSDARTVLPQSLRGRIRATRRLAEQLTTHGLTLCLQTPAKSEIRLGYDAQPTWLARLLGLGAADLPVSAVRQLFRG